MWRTLNIERPTLNIEIRGRVYREGAKGDEGRKVFGEIVGEASRLKEVAGSYRRKE